MPPASEATPDHRDSGSKGKPRSGEAREQENPLERQNERSE